MFLSQAARGGLIPQAEKLWQLVNSHCCANTSDGTSDCAGFSSFRGKLVQAAGFWWLLETTSVLMVYVTNASWTDMALLL